jgi:hypothetical protein
MTAPSPFIQASPLQSLGILKRSVSLKHPQAFYDHSIEFFSVLLFDRFNAQKRLRTFKSAWECLGTHGGGVRKNGDGTLTVTEQKRYLHCCSEFDLDANESKTDPRWRNLKYPKPLNFDPTKLYLAPRAKSNLAPKKERAKRVIQSLRVSKDQIYHIKRENFQYSPKFKGLG